MNTLKDENYDPRLVAILEELKPVSPRDPRIAARAKARFLAEAVSVREEQRHSIWIFFQQKEKLAMKLAISALVIVSLLFGGSATVAAAQDDLPYEPLYQIKLVSEDVNLWLTADPMAKIEMLMQQAQTRTEEMVTLTTKGIAPPPALAAQMEERIQRALQLTAKLDDTSQIAVRQQIRERLQEQEQLMNQLQIATCLACEPILQQTRDMLRNQLRDMEGKPGEPETTPNQIQNQIQNQTRITQTPQPGNDVVAPKGTVNTPAADGTDQQNRNGSNNPSVGTPMPQNNSDGGGSPQNGNDDGDGGGNGSGDDGGQGSGGQGGNP
jgi:hypothetical protein